VLSLGDAAGLGAGQVRPDPAARSVLLIMAGNPSAAPAALSASPAALNARGRAFEQGGDMRRRDPMRPMAQSRTPNQQSRRTTQGSAIAAIDRVFGPIVITEFVFVAGHEKPLLWQHQRGKIASSSHLQM
jgi:hypothetical protein